MTVRRPGWTKRSSSKYVSSYNRDCSDVGEGRSIYEDLLIGLASAWISEPRLMISLRFYSPFRSASLQIQNIPSPLIWNSFFITSNPMNLK
jgi:hypothetical protein